MYDSVRSNWLPSFFSRIRALTGAAYCVGSLMVPLLGSRTLRGPNLAPQPVQGLTWALRHKIDVNEEFKQ